MQKLYGIFKGNTFLYNEGVFLRQEDALEHLEVLNTKDYEVGEVRKSEVVESILNFTKKNVETMRTTIFYDFQYDYIGHASTTYINTLEDFLSYFKAMEEDE